MEKDCKKDRIQILADITVKPSSVSNVNLPQQCFRSPISVQKDRDKENIPNADYTIVDQSNGSRRNAITYFSDEEPVFSDSEEEREYTKRILESQIITYELNDQPKTKSVEVQCDQASYDQEILEFAARCAKFNLDDASEEIKKLIQLCKHFSSKYQCNTSTPTIENCSNNTYLEECRKSLSAVRVSAEFMPSKDGSKDFESEHVEDGNIVNVCGITESKQTRKSVKANNKAMKGVQTILRRSSRIHKFNKNTTVRKKEELSKKLDKINFKMEWNITKNCNNLNKERKRKKRTVEEIMQDFLCKSKKRKHKESDSDEIDTHIRIRLPRNVVRPLARNWMKPNKNRINYHYLNYIEPTFSVQRGPKIRMLYSPTHWLESIGHMKSRKYKKEMQAG